MRLDDAVQDQRSPPRMSLRDGLPWGVCVCNSLPSNKTVTSRCSRRLALPILGRSLREFLQRLLEPLQRVGLFLVFCVLFLLLQRVLLRLLRVLSAGALKIHDHSPLG